MLQLLPQMLKNPLEEIVNEIVEDGPPSANKSLPPEDLPHCQQCSLSAWCPNGFDTRTVP